MSIATPIAESLKFSDFIVNTVTGDLDDSLARRRVRGSAGASIAWILGHLLHYRHQMLRLLGGEETSSWARFAETGASDGADYPPIADLVRTWNALSPVVLATVAGAPDVAFTAPLGGPHGEKRVLDTIVFLMWHESYHLGQLGTLRAQFGLTPTATLAEEASRRSA